jgi:hypothetical protein
MIEYMLTTVDNPYSPFEQFDDWFAYDTSKGYHSLPYLARVCKQSNELSETDQIIENNRAILEIVQFNLLGIYKKVEQEVSL